MSRERLVTSALGFTTGLGIGAVVLWRGLQTYFRPRSPEEIAASIDAESGKTDATPTARSRPGHR